jgi:heme/copper-type cytochrome/quinol oxidase subunit 2
VVWALLAKFLIKQPPAVQALALGLCTGLFVTAAAEANERDPVLTTTVVLVLVSGGIAGALFYAGLVVRRRRGWEPGETAPRWLHAVYAAVWLVGIVAALLALFGEGGFKVAVLAVVPLVLLAPTALQGIRALLGR